VTIVVIDLIPALLSWEGRDRSGPPELAPDAVEAVTHLYSHYRLVGITDAGVAATTLITPLDDARLAELFESLGTAAGYGPQVNPRVVRRITRHARGGHDVVVVTGREPLARTMSRSRMGVVLTTWTDFGGVPEAVATVLSGRVSP
jgi:hypothetical protein